jgi:ferritin-like metal-binding protein YciE
LRSSPLGAEAARPIREWTLKKIEMPVGANPPRNSVSICGVLASGIPPGRRNAMTVKTMEDLFVETLKDIYYAEKQILKALPGMVKKAGAEKLKDALETHRQETEGQVARLDEVFKLFDVTPKGKKCEAIEGIISEAKEHMKDIEDPEVLDAGMIGSAQAVEHYEITRYGTLIAWAKQLGRKDAVELLEENLKQEKHADQLLTRIAESAVNERAAA